jgi:hypothetical protein
VTPTIIGGSSDAYQLLQPFREPLHFIVRTVTVVTLPTPMQFLSDGPLPGSAIYRHAYRHRDKPFTMRFSERRDGRDACDGGLLEYLGTVIPSSRLPSPKKRLT